MNIQYNNIIIYNKDEYIISSATKCRLEQLQENLHAGELIQWSPWALCGEGTLPTYPWFTSAWTAEHLTIWPVADDFRLVGRGRPGSRSAASMMLDIISICRRRTACLEQPSSCHHCRRQSLERCWKLICLFKGRGAGDIWTGAWKCTDYYN